MRTRIAIPIDCIAVRRTIQFDGKYNKNIIEFSTELP